MSIDLIIRRATAADLPAIVAMLADDELGRQREQLSDPLPAAYLTAFAAIDRDPQHELIVGTFAGATICTLHLTCLPSLSFQGGTRAQIESVRVAQPYRGQGIGSVLFQWAIARARARGCHMIQLTTAAQRTAAQRFYTRLGFSASHVGMKLFLSAAPISAPDLS
jgi:ribosomal protein S18 acetylase RimI-like enzyme